MQGTLFEHPIHVSDIIGTGCPVAKVISYDSTSSTEGTHSAECACRTVWNERNWVVRPFQDD